MARYGVTFMDSYPVPFRKSRAVTLILPQIVASTCCVLYTQLSSYALVAFLKKVDVSKKGVNQKYSYNKKRKKFKQTNSRALNRKRKGANEEVVQNVKVR